MNSNNLKARAHALVHQALHDGKLTRKPCEVCNAVKASAHHADYAQPLNVQWLCDEHHAQAHDWIRRRVFVEQTKPVASGVKLIQYFQTSRYGVAREFIFPRDCEAALALHELTGKTTISKRTRDLITTISGGLIQWQEILAP